MLPALQRLGGIDCLLDLARAIADGRSDEGY
jgi:hypothetical protein